MHIPFFGTGGERTAGFSADFMPEKGREAALVNNVTPDFRLGTTGVSGYDDEEFRWTEW